MKLPQLSTINLCLLLRLYLPICFLLGSGSRRFMAPYCAPARGATSLMPEDHDSTQTPCPVEQRGLSNWNKVRPIFIAYRRKLICALPPQS